MPKHVVIVVQARMTSTRLPGKVLKTVLGKPLLAYQLERLKRVQGANALIVAATTRSEDDPIIDLCKKMRIPTYRGDEHDVLLRTIWAARKMQATHVIRITSDCPLIDPDVVDAVITAFHVSEPDYLSNSLPVPTFPRGLDTEMMRMHTLEKAHFKAKDKHHREHVTAYIYENPDQFRIEGYMHGINLSHHRWTVDTPEDFELIRRILEHMNLNNPKFSWLDVLDLLDFHRDWIELNQHITQKPVDSHQTGDDTPSG